MRRGLRRFGVCATLLAALLTCGCVRHVRDLELVSVERAQGVKSATPMLRLAFASQRDFRGLRGHRVFLWTSLCPARDDMRIDTASVFLNNVEVEPGQDLPARVPHGAPPLTYRSAIAYDTAFIDTDREEAGPYRLPLPPDGLDLCFRVESTGWRRFRTNDVLIPKDAIDQALRAAPGR